MSPNIKRSSLLTALGTDLIDLVLCELSNKELYALCLVSRESRWLAEPYLYSNLDWYWTLHSEPPILPFLRTIIERPTLAKHVHHITLRGSWQNICWTGQDYHPGTDRDRLDIPLAISQHARLDFVKVRSLLDDIKGPPEFIDTWDTAIQAGKMDGLVALLLSQTPNLKHFSIDGRFVIDTKITSKIFSLALIEKVPGLPTYSRLQEVRHAPLFLGEDYYGRDVDMYLPYFALTAIETLLTPLDNPSNLAKKLQSFDVLSTLKHLKIAQCRETQLKSLLCLCPNLQSFSWQAFSEGYQEAPPDTMDLNEIRDALTPFQHSLRSLALGTKFMVEQDQRFFSGRIIGDLSWVRSFDRLHDLTLDIVLLEELIFGHQVTADKLLPQSLEVLILHHDDLSSLFGTSDSDSQLVELTNDYFRSLKDTRPGLAMSLSIVDLNGYFEPEDVSAIKTIIQRNELNITLREYQNTRMYENGILQ